MDVNRKAVLLLNSQFVPLGVVSVKKSASLVFREKAEIIEIEKDGNYLIMNVKNWLEYSEEMKNKWDEINRPYFSSLYKTFGCPFAIKLNDFQRILSKVKLTRKNIFIRDEYTCAYCGEKLNPNYLSVDHIIPKSRGGRNTWENLITSCIRCNSLKNNRTPKEANLELKFQARHPSVYEDFKKFFLYSKIDKTILEQWKNFFPEEFHELLKRNINEQKK